MALAVLVNAALIVATLSSATTQERSLPNVPGLRFIPGSEQGKTDPSGAADGTSGPGGANMSLGALFDDDPQASCLQGGALFAVHPGGVSMVFHTPRSGLPFVVDERPSPAERNVALTFSTPKCRLTITVDKEVLADGVWRRLAPQPLE